MNLRRIIYIIFLLLVVILNYFVSIQPHVNYMAEFESVERFSEAMSDTLIVTSPSLNQLEELSKRYDITFKPYYLFNSDITMENSLSEARVYVFNDSNINDFSLNSSSLIIQENESTVYIGVDQIFAFENKVSIGDEISVQLQDLTVEGDVSHIYSSNYFDSQGTVFLNLETLESQGQSLNLNFFQGSFIDDSDAPNLKNELLNSYQPLGILQTRDEFDSDIAYQNYLDDFNSKDYSNRIYDFDELVLDLELDINSNSNIALFSLFTSGLMYIVMLLFPIIYVYVNDLKSDLKLFQEKGKSLKKIFNKYYFIETFSVIFFIISYLFLIAIYRGQTEEFVTYSFILENSWLILSSVLIITVLSIVITGYINLITTKRLNQLAKKKKSIQK